MVSRLITLTKRFSLILSAPIVAACMILSTAAPAAAFTDGLSFVYCNGRFSMGTVNLSHGTVTAYGCSNGYFYVVTKSTVKDSLVASITRTVKYYNYEVATGYAYQVISPMVARVSGACYDIWGFMSGGGKGWRFCW